MTSYSADSTGYSTNYEEGAGAALSTEAPPVAGGKQGTASSSNGVALSFPAPLDDAECCALCLEPFSEGESVRVLPCGHGFHQTCIDRWLLEVQAGCRRSCPVCKQNPLALLKEQAPIRGSEQPLDDDTEQPRAADETQSVTSTTAATTSDSSQSVDGSSAAQRAHSWPCPANESTSERVVSASGLRHSLSYPAALQTLTAAHQLIDLDRLEAGMHTAPSMISHSPSASRLSDDSWRLVAALNIQMRAESMWLYGGRTV